MIDTLRERGNNNATINRKMAALSKLLRKACKMGDIYNLPEFRRQKERQGRIRFLGADEEQRLFGAIRARCDDSYQLSVFLVAEAAARRSGCPGMICRTRDRHSGRQYRPQPNRSPHGTCPGSDPDTTRGPFSMYSQVRFRAIWNDAKAEVGLAKDDEVVPHILRHTCASRLVRGGI